MSEYSFMTKRSGQKVATKRCAIIQQSPGKIKRAKKARPGRTWLLNGRREKRRFRFIGNPGVKISPSDPSSPLCVFKTFITDTIIDNIVKCTNDYARKMLSHPTVQEQLASNKHKLFYNWKEVNSDEIMTYFAVCLLMGIIDKPTYQSYWTSDPFFQTPIFSRLISRKRFFQIRATIHFSEVNEPDTSDPLYKLCDFLEQLRCKFRDNYIPGLNISIDEYLALWKGRLPFRVYIPSKRERYGIKIYMMCESSSAYLSEFIIYVGSLTETDFPESSMPLPMKWEEYKSPSKIVLSLMQHYLNKGYCVTLDNYYNSPELATALFHFDTDCYGTLRKKEDLPADFWKWAPKKGDEPIRRFSDNTMVLRWSDESKLKSTKIVSMLSTVHVGEMVDTHRMNRISQTPIRKPDVIADYNTTMGGVDTLSRVLIPYSGQRKGCVKWYRKLAELLLDIAVFNSFVCWRKLNNLPKRGLKVSHLGFRKRLITEMITMHAHGSGPPTGRTSDTLFRLTERHFCDLYPGKPGTIPEKKPQLPCRVCRCRYNKRKDTRYWCPDCKVGLCFPACFKRYHTIKDYEKNDSDNDSDIDSQED